MKCCINATVVRNGLIKIIESLTWSRIDKIQTRILLTVKITTVLGLRSRVAAMSELSYIENRTIHRVRCPDHLEPGFHATKEIETRC